MTRCCRGPWQGPLAAGAWLAGVWVQLQQPAVLPFAQAIAWFGLGLALLAAGWAWRRSGQARGSGLVVCLAAALAGAASTDWRASLRLSHSLPASLEGQDLTLTGIVAAMPDLGAAGPSFVFEVESATAKGREVRVPPRVSLGWFHGWDGESLMAAPVRPVVAGDRWQLPVRLKRPHGLRNPMGFDLELWLFEREVMATGHVRPGARHLGATVGYPIERLRQHWRDRILQSVADPSRAGIIAALAVGDQGAIARDDWDMFRVTGVAHLMSISGLHVTLFAWVAAGGVGWAWRRVPLAMLHVPAPLAARWGGLLLATLYASVAGWGVPAQRTLWMVAAVACVRQMGRRWPQPHIWIAAGWVVIVSDPWAMLQPGFWLSFVAVGLLIAAEPVRGAGSRAGWRAAAASGLRAQAVATVALAPLSVLFFHQLSLVGVVANLVAIPWVTWVVTPLSLAGLAFPPVWHAAAVALQPLMGLLNAMASWPHAVWSAGASPAWAIVAGLVGGGLAVAPVPWRLRVLGLPLMVPMLLPAARVPDAGRFEAVAADVGQGTAVLVRTHRHLLLYDTGPRYSPLSDAGGRVLLPLLSSRGETAVNLLVLSHGDSDHLGGAQSLLRTMSVHATASSLPPEHELRPLLPRHTRCEAGQRWQWDGVDFEFLHPTAADYLRPSTPNASSCVLAVTDAAGRRVLLSGDIEAAQEAALVGRGLGPSLRSQVLLVPHHGSRTSSTDAFLAAVMPAEAVVQAAYRSRYGHPAPDVMQRYRTRGISVRRSDTCGAWTWPGAAAAAGLEGRISGDCERDLNRRYWHHPGNP